MGLFDFLGYLGQGAGAIATGQMRGEQNALDILARRRAAKELADLKRMQLQADQEQAAMRAQAMEEERARRAAMPFLQTFYGPQSADILHGLEEAGTLGAAAQLAGPVLQRAGYKFNPEDYTQGLYQPGVPSAILPPEVAGMVPPLPPQVFQQPGQEVGQPKFRFPGSAKTQQAGAKVDIAETAEERKRKQSVATIKYLDAKTGQIVELTPLQAENLQARTEGTQANTRLTEMKTIFESLKPEIEQGKLDIATVLAGIRKFTANETAKRWRAQLGETARHNRSTEAIAQQRAKTAQQVADLRGVLTNLAVAKNPYEIASLKNRAAVLGSLLDPTKKMALAAKLKVATQLMNVGGVQVPMDPGDTERMFGEIDAILGGIEEGAQAPAAPAGIPAAAPTRAAASPPAFDQGDINEVSRLLNTGAFEATLRSLDPKTAAGLKRVAEYVKQQRKAKGRL